MYSPNGLRVSPRRGCPIRILKAHRLLAAPLERFAGLRVLLRPLAPRHPPRPLLNLVSLPVFALVSFGWLSFFSIGE